ncbi:hypothetical protein MPH_08884 [Macrophomina phaseolina MS6]|uniref:Uncharacterized protein n=1 Tax=Macrophomina phaseolina (strain MS6) TaxID=1126212 RepID=K2SAQ6_MACPH|nr:hypothetical protein MPH_08884 [Macrophomina phaseolina MS6]
MTCIFYSKQPGVSFTPPVFGSHFGEAKAPTLLRLTTSPRGTPRIEAREGGYDLPGKGVKRTSSTSWRCNPRLIIPIRNALGIHKNGTRSICRVAQGAPRRQFHVGPLISVVNGDQWSPPGRTQQLMSEAELKRTRNGERVSYRV